MQIFEEVLFFKLRTTTEKQTINSTYLVSVGYGRLAEVKGHEIESVKSVLLISRVFCVFIEAIICGNDRPKMLLANSP